MTPGIIALTFTAWVIASAVLTPRIGAWLARITSESTLRNTRAADWGTVSVSPGSSGRFAAQASARLPAELRGARS